MDEPPDGALQAVPQADGKLLETQTSRLQQSLVPEMEIKGKREVALAKGGLDAFLNHLQLGHQIRWQAGVQVVKCGPVSIASLASAREMEQPGKPILPALLANLAEVHGVDVAGLLPLSYRGTGKEVNLGPAVHPNGVRSTGMIEMSSDHRIDGAAQIFQTNLIQLLSPVQTKEGVAVHVLHHEDVSKDPSEPFLLNAKRPIIRLWEIRAAVRRQSIASDEEDGHHRDIDQARPVPRLQVCDHAPHPCVLEVHLTHQLTLLVPVLSKELKRLLPKPFEGEEQVESHLSVKLAMSVKIQMALGLVEESLASTTW